MPVTPPEQTPNGRDALDTVTLIQASKGRADPGGVISHYNPRATVLVNGVQVTVYPRLTAAERLADPVAAAAEDALFLSLFGANYTHQEMVISGTTAFMHGLTTVGGVSQRVSLGLRKSSSGTSVIYQDMRPA